MGLFNAQFTTAAKVQHVCDLAIAATHRQPLWMSELMTHLVLHRWTTSQTILHVQIQCCHLLGQSACLILQLCLLRHGIALLAARKPTGDIAALCTVHRKLDAVKGLGLAVALWQHRLVLVKDILNLQTPTGDSWIQTSMADHCHTFTQGMGGRSGNYGGQKHTPSQY